MIGLREGYQICICFMNFVVVEISPLKHKINHATVSTRGLLSNVNGTL